MSKAAEIIKDLMSYKGLTQRELAGRLGEDGKLLSYQLLHNKDFAYDRFAELVQHAGYQIKLVNIDGPRRVTDKFFTSRKGVYPGAYYMEEDGQYTGIFIKKDGKIELQNFPKFEDCREWLDYNEKIEENYL